jgi:hypothetical protein
LNEIPPRMDTDECGYKPLNYNEFQCKYAKKPGRKGRNFNGNDTIILAE